MRTHKSAFGAHTKGLQKDTVREKFSLWKCPIPPPTKKKKKNVQLNEAHYKADNVTKELGDFDLYQ